MSALNVKETAIKKCYMENLSILRTVMRAVAGWKWDGARGDKDEFKSRLDDL